MTGISAETNASPHVLPNDQPMVMLGVKAAFDGLSETEKLYAHHMSRASHYGGLIVLFQTSVESPNIFRLIQRINSLAFSHVDKLQIEEFGIKAKIASYEKFKIKCCEDADLTQEEFQAYAVYCSAFYSNMGNYKGFGDLKIVPGLSKEAFEKIVVYVCDKVAGGRGKSAEADLIWSLWTDVRCRMYNLASRHRQLGLGSNVSGGVTKYFSANCSTADSDLINRYFKLNKMEGYNNRVIKSVDETSNKTQYEIISAAVEDKVIKTDKFEGCNIVVKAGDYQPLLKMVNAELTECKKYAANENQWQMIEQYIKSFESGSLEAHKEGSRLWIKDKGPNVESYIGFIETYRDPVGMRGEFEGFVAVVNRQQSDKFQRLVAQAETLLTRLPWPAAFEKDTFLRPDFTSLDIVAFAGSGVPSGINIPNYDEIRQDEGFKNVNLGNVIQSSLKADPGRKASFVSGDDHSFLEKWRVPAFEVQVGLHELLGHGSGKLLIRSSKDGSLNFAADLVDPLTNKSVVDSCSTHLYDSADSYDSKFTSLGSAFEECRAEAVGLLLSTYHDVIRFSIFHPVFVYIISYYESHLE